ncbi:hypothetical protein BegalDRAFT_0830 [Beggiatoa alba B18LD]|uniref:Uncharacterized protein n=2 Tax=Beggiatoa alba TaxID=1022 RepID=I3CDP8_9GAMM|nr:hypothetical protein BegalDRAFT_0830 [Beggiatoa alba B18LD]
MDVHIELGEEQERQLYLFLRHNQLNLSDFLKSLILEELTRETLIHSHHYEFNSAILKPLYKDALFKPVGRRFRQKIHVRYRDK